MTVTAFALAQRFLGMREVPGALSNPAVLAMLQLAGKWPTDDATPWCSAFAYTIAWLLDLPRPDTRVALAARSWHSDLVAPQVRLEHAVEGFDLVVLTRGAGGHVGFYAGHSGSVIQLLGGNQGDQVSIAAFDRARLLSVRRLWSPA